MNSVRLLIVIPTRNRASLAMKAIGSVLRESLPSIRILVSDNSTDVDQVTELVDFCRLCPPEVVRYVRPSDSPPMTAHWEWAIQEACKDNEWTHVAYLTDRMVFKAGDLATLLRIAASNPGEIVSYNLEQIDDLELPVLLQTKPWSGRLFKVDTKHLLYLSSRGIFPNSLPRMLNSVTPRAILDQIYAARGHVFDSISPDYYFCYQALELSDSVLYYDKTCLIHYALARSNGASHSRGISSADALDFDRQLQFSESLLTPLPTIMNTWNLVFHEYCFARSISTSGNLPPLEQVNYFATIRKAVRQIEDPELAAEMARVRRSAQSCLRLTTRSNISATAERAARRAWIVRTAASKPLSSAIQLGGRFLRRRPRPGGHLYRAHAYAVGRMRSAAFDSADSAIDYANESPLRPTATFFSMFQMLHPRGHVHEVPLPTDSSPLPRTPAQMSYREGRVLGQR